MGKRLKRARLEAGMSVAQLQEKIYRLYRAEIGETTIRYIEREKTLNPGYKTVEFISLGLGLDPIQILRMGLEDVEDITERPTDARLAHLWKLYAEIKAERRPFADEWIKMMTEKFEEWR